jgi:hypothetical protein
MVVSTYTGGARGSEASPGSSPANFGDDVAFLQQYTNVVVLGGHRADAQIAVAPAWQGRVMTSTAQGIRGRSFGWLNRKLIGSREMLPHFNPLGGEDRLWLGPEGGQFSIYFGKGASFDLDHWYVPRAFDTQPFEIAESAEDHVIFQSKVELTNYSGTNFQAQIRRTVRLLDNATAWKGLSIEPVSGVSLVAYESVNQLTNAGAVSWSRDTGLLSIWVLGMFNPSAQATIVIPIKPGSEDELGRKLTADYFGPIPADKLKVTDSAVYLRADGGLRSKVGINPRRSLGKLGSYDAESHVLTIVQFDQPPRITEYVNSLWKIQSDPFAGDAANAYNDGPPGPGQPPMGPFFELESSSPAAALAPGESLSHTHRTLHLTGSEARLDRVARSVLGVSLSEITQSVGGRKTP